MVILKTKQLKQKDLLSNMSRLATTKKNIFKLDTRVFMVFFCLCAQETQSK